MTLTPRLVARPLLDSAAHAERCRRDLAVARERAAHLGQGAVEAIVRGVYLDRTGRPVEWRAAVAAAIAAKQSIPPDAALPMPSPPAFATTQVEVANQSTLVAAQRLTDMGERVLALNFANGITPGGGFLHGARAQEEVLCRSSALYATLRDDPMYDAHRGRSLPDSTDWAILSPDVPVFRTDEGTPLDAPWSLSVISCAAPYAPKVGQPRAGDLLQQRIARVLAIARAHGYSALVLGAWGCGAFGNDPQRTARDFHAALLAHAGAFAQVVFAIADWSPERRFLAPFATVFATVP
jgi:uncharacterized protein (TIGR02452 family)